jgi:hypothetical protein
MVIDGLHGCGLLVVTEGLVEVVVVVVVVVDVMGKVPVRLKEVVYTLSPYHQNVMAGLWKDVPYKLSKKFHENWVSAFTLVVPIVGTYM